MYNTKQKAKFLLELDDKNADLYSSIFRKTEPVEKKHDTDCSGFNEDMFYELCDQTGATNASSLSVLKSRLSRYTKWCIENKLTDAAHNPYKLFVAKASSKEIYFGNIEEFRETFECVLDKEKNERPNFFLLDWITVNLFWYGLTNVEVCMLKWDSVNCDKQTITIKTRNKHNVVGIDSKLAEKLEELKQIKTIEQYNPRVLKILPYVHSKWVLDYNVKIQDRESWQLSNRVSIRFELGKSDMQKSPTKRRFATKTVNCKTLSQNGDFCKLYDAGFHHAYDNKSGIDIEHFSSMVQKDISRTKAYAMAADYEAWKKHFGL